LGVDSKRAAFERLGADVLVVPECPSAPAFSRELGVSFAWRGRYAAKGLGVFALAGWQVAPAEERTRLPWVLPLRVLDPGGAEVALLLAVWTVAMPGAPSYADQVAAAISAWEDEIRDGATIVAGDFNCSAQSAKPAGHLRNVARLTDLGAVSAYHRFKAVEHGCEQEMTLRWVGRGGRATGFHCDFVFVSAALAPTISRAEVGRFEDWIETGLSDHSPVTVQFAY
jgi:endonuclease/exonuclease/phosphatase (EEP) superfamily protein YafD